MNGWFSLHRKLLDSRVFNDPDPFVMKLFIWCLCRANWQQKCWRNGCEIEPGQFVTGRLNAAEELNVSESKFRRAIEKLKEFGCITTEATNRFTVITVVNWGKYQDNDHSKPPDRPTTDQQPTSSRPTTDQRPATNEQGNKKNNAISFDLLPQRFQAERFRIAITHWSQTRSVDGMKIGLDQATLELQLSKVAAYTDDEIFTVLADAAAGGWKLLQMPTRNGRKQPQTFNQMNDQSLSDKVKRELEKAKLETRIDGQDSNVIGHVRGCVSNRIGMEGDGS